MPDVDLTYTGAQLMGLPHIGAEYVSGWAGKRKRYERVAEVCQVCGHSRAESTHHIVPVGMGGRQSKRVIQADCDYCRKVDSEFIEVPSFIATKMGVFEVFTPLIAVCGDGTKGCHGDFEAKRLTIVWEWSDELSRDLWERGWILSHGYAPNGEELFEFGHYSIFYKNELERKVCR